MNNLVKYGMLAVYVGAGTMAVSPEAMAADAAAQPADGVQLAARDASPMMSPSAEKSAETNTTPGSADGLPVTYKGATLNLGGLRLTPGGFIAAEGVFRNHTEAADINSDFKGYPFPNNNNYYSNELRFSARQSRIQLLAEAPNDGPNRVEGFIAADFQGAGTTSNQNQSNSYVTRVREAYVTWARKDYNFYALAGQSWSLATLNKKGLNPRSEDIPLTIDSQYVVGFNWLRVPQLRVVQNFGTLAALGISIEQPENQIKGTAPVGSLATNTGDNAGLLNNTATYSNDVLPDVTVKLAADPGYGHYEVYSLTRFLHDRAENIPGMLGTEHNHTTAAQSFGVGAILPVVPKVLDFQATGLIGHGNGRYASAQLGDSTYNTNNGEVAALKSGSALLGVIAHPTPAIDFYTYGGYEHIAGAYTYANGATATYTGCQVNYDAGTQTAAGVITAPACASGNIATAKELTAGAWWKFYKGPIGYLTTGVQYSFNSIRTFGGRDGSQGKTNDSAVHVSFRFYPYQ